MSGIDNLVSHIENNQSQKDGTISGAEWQLVAKVFGAPALKEGETFSKKDIKKLDKEEQQQAKEHNAKEKENKEDNNSLKKAQEVLNNPEHVKQLLHMCEVQAKLIKNGADVVYYESFLNSIPVGGLKDDDTVKRIQNLLDEKGKVSASKESSSIVEPSNDTGNTSESLQKKLEKVDSYDLGLFKSTIESLQSGKISIDQLDPLNEITQIIKEIAQLDPAIALKQIDTFLDNKISSLSEPLKTEFKKKVQEFHPLLESLLQRKDILQKFADIVDNNIKGLSYQSLLETAKDKNTLNSPEAKKAINNLFHIDEKLFNQLVADFNDPQKKEQVETIVKQYITLSNPNISLDGTSLVLKDITLDDGKTKKSSFTLLNQKKEPVKINIDGKDETVSPYFGKKGSGNALTFKESAANTWFSDALGIKKGVLSLSPELTGLMQQTIDTKTGPKSFADAIKSFFDSPLFKDLWKSLLTLMSMVGNEKSGVQLDYLNAIDVMKSNWSTQRLKKYPQYTEKEDGDWLAKETNKYVFEKQDNDGVKTDNFLGGEKHFFSTILEPNEQIDYILNSSERVKLRNENSKGISMENFRINNGVEKKFQGNNNVATTKLPEKKKDSIFESGKEYLELSVDGNLPGKTELKEQNSDNPYLVIDGQAIALSKDNGSYKGVIGTVNNEGKLFMKKISLDDKLNISIESEELTNLNINDAKEYQKIYTGGKYDLKYIFDHKESGNLLYLYMHATQRFSKDDSKVGAIYNAIDSNLPSSLSSVQGIFMKFQKGFLSQLNKGSLTKESLKELVNTTKKDLLAITGLGSTPILQEQVDAWYNQFDFGATTDKPSTQKKPVETPVAPVVGEKKV